MSPAAPARAGFPQRGAAPTMPAVPVRPAGVATLMLLASFLCATLAPCPASERSAGSRVHASRAPGPPTTRPAPVPADARGDTAGLLPACPCGCERAPLAGSSARLGVCLPSAAPRLAAANAVALAIAPLLRRSEILAPRIDHVPLPTPLRAAVPL